MSLADEFLADLGEDEDLSSSAQDDAANNQSDEESEEEGGAEGEDNDNNNNNGHKDSHADLEAMLIDTTKFTNVGQITKVYNSQKLNGLLQRIEQRFQNTRAREILGPVEEDPEYQLVVESNNLTVEIANEIATIHKFIRDHYSKCFPELDNLIVNPLDYARVVQRIGNEMDLTKVDLSDILPAATIMVVTVTATTTSGHPLPEDEMKRVQEACAVVLSLDETRKRIVEYVESRMSIIAPNLSTIVGSSTAAKLMSVAGGLTALSKLHANNLQSLGASKKALAGLSSATVRPHAGFLYEADIITKTPPSLRTKAIRVAAGKCTLAARVDSFHEDPSGGIGRKLREEIEKKIEKWQEPPPAKLPKPLPAPDDKPKKRRGGKRIRKIKQKYEMTELRKQANRVAFGTASQDEFRDSGKGLGMIGIAGSGKVRLSAVDKGILKKQKQQQKQFGTSGATSGLSSSLAFTPVQGLELSNPEAAQQRINQANQKYFGTSSFVKK